MLKHVAQEDSNGCAVASLAMILRRTYQDMKREILERFPDCDFDRHGITHIDVQEILADHGWWNQFHYKFVRTGQIHDPWPPLPWAEVHYCEVHVTPHSGGHAVVMLRTGSVLDPLTTEERRLTDYPSVNSVMGLKRPC